MRDHRLYRRVVSVVAVLVLVAYVGTRDALRPRPAAAATTGTYIDWDAGTRTFVTNGGYGRVKRIGTGELVLAYSAGQNVAIRKSDDNGLSWGAPVTVAHTDGYTNTNAEVIQLANGWLLYSWDGRPTTPGGTLPYVIRTSLSRDNGLTWTDQRTVYTADVVSANGAWEPAAMQVSSGEIQLFFANENPYRTTNEQEISLARSFDNGLTWTAATRVSFRAGHRDGMPVPLQLSNGQGLVFAIEDNGLNGTFKPAIVWSSTADDWNQAYADGTSPRRWSALRSDYQLPAAVYAGAPYLVQLPGGETVLSVQSSEGRSVNNDSVAIMQVYVGDPGARNFANKTTPFTDVPATGSGLWNSLAVLDDDTVMAVSTLSGAGQNGIWTVIGHVVRS